MPGEMQRRSWATRIVGLAACAAGCSTTRYGGQRPTPEIEAALRAENPRAPMDVVVVVGPLLPWNQELPLLRVDPAFGVIVKDPAQGDQALSPKQVIALRVHHRARGAAVGAGIGLLAGGAMGASLAYAGDRNCPSVSEDCSGRGTGMLIGGIFLGMLGALVGLGFGALLAPTTTVRFGEPRPEE